MYEYVATRKRFRDAVVKAVWPHSNENRARVAWRHVMRSRGAVSGRRWSAVVLAMRIRRTSTALRAHGRLAISTRAHALRGDGHRLQHRIHERGDVIRECGAHGVRVTPAPHAASW